MLFVNPDYYSNSVGLQLKYLDLLLLQSRTNALNSIRCGIVVNVVTPLINDYGRK